MQSGLYLWAGRELGFAVVRLAAGDNHGSVVDIHTAAVYQSFVAETGMIGEAQYSSDTQDALAVEEGLCDSLMRMESAFMAPSYRNKTWPARDRVEFYGTHVQVILLVPVMGIIPVMLLIAKPECLDSVQFDLARLH